ncbi:MAG TPA: glycosyltransferase [Anaerolineae bacterium]|nr:glycosyltransferase [Anaerolineae bacterium]
MVNLRTTGVRETDDNTATSVIMPCFNVANTVDEAISSLLKQTRSDFEIVAVDDGSTDATGEHLADWTKHDPRVSVLSLPHGGIIEALNAGISTCNAPFIARMDADDRAHPKRLEKQISFLESHPNVAVVGCLVEGFPVGEVGEGFRLYMEWLNRLVTSEEIAREIFIESPLVHPSVIIRRTWLERVGGYQDLGWPEDYDLWLRMYVAGARFAKVPQVLLYWREHKARLTRTDDRYSDENLLRAKAHYLLQGPLKDRNAVIVWGAGRMGRRISKLLLQDEAPLVAFVDIDPTKIGRTRRGLPIIPPDKLVGWWRRSDHPIVLAAVASRGARSLIRDRLTGMGLVEGSDWWSVA